MDTPRLFAAHMRTPSMHEIAIQGYQRKQKHEIGCEEHTALGDAAVVVLHGPMLGDSLRLHVSVVCVPVLVGVL